jgi:hypothetical protein
METRSTPPHDLPSAAVRASAAAAAAASAGFLIASLAAIAEIAAAPTAVAGVRSGAWTPLTGAWASIAGADSFGGGFDFLPVLLGLIVIGAIAFALGLLGCAAVAFLVGTRATPLASALAGAAYGLLVQVGVVLAIVSALLGADLAFRSLPSWGWWIATLTWGAALGLTFAASLRAAWRVERPLPAGGAA